MLIGGKDSGLVGLVVVVLLVELVVLVVLVVLILLVVLVLLFVLGSLISDKQFAIKRIISNSTIPIAIGTTNTTNTTLPIAIGTTTFPLTPVTHADPGRG